MTRTTELLKSLKRWEDEIVDASIFTPNNIAKVIFRQADKSELRGRLDALKEEVEWLKICYRRIVKIIIVDDNMENNPTAVFIKDRLASIQEEIKLIESAGVRK
jgi:hypothetical protein